MLSVRFIEVLVLTVGEDGFEAGLEPGGVEVAVVDAAAALVGVTGFTGVSSSSSVSDSSLDVSSSLLDSDFALSAAAGLDWWLGRNRL